MMKEPWTCENDPDEPESRLVKWFAFNGYCRFMVGSTPDQQKLILKYLNWSYQQGIEDAMTIITGE